MQRILWVACLSSAFWALQPKADAIVQNNQWATASMQDIVSALGPDAQGLSISPDKLPDLFELTASRLDENPKKFIVEEPYTGGRWRGGKAVIEYARDLSYTLVSVYDKSGRRQRIYSVRTRPHPANEKSSSSEAVASIDVERVEETPPPPPPKSESPSKTVSAAPAAPPPVTASTPTPSQRRKHRRKDSEETATVVASKESFKSSAVSAAPASSPVGTKPKKEKDALRIAAVEPGAAYEWDEQQGAYVPVKSREGSTKAAPAAESARSLAEQTPPQQSASTSVSTRSSSRRSKRRRSEHERSTESRETTAQAAPSLHPSAPQQNTVDLVQVPEGGSSPGSAGEASSASSKSGPDSVPSTEELLAAPTPEDHSRTQTVSSEKSSSRRVKRSRKEEKEGSRAAAAPETPTQAAAQELPPSKSQSSSRGKSQAPNVIDIEPVGAAPASQEQEAATPKKNKEHWWSKKKQDRGESAAAQPTLNDQARAAASSNGSIGSQQFAEPPVVVPVQEREVKPVSTPTPSELAAAEAVKRAKEMVNAAPPPSKPAATAPKKNDDMLDAALRTAGPDTTEGDHWVPKPVKPPPPESIPSTPKSEAQIAMATKPPDASIDNMMKIAAENQMPPADSEKWVPKPVQLPKADQDVVAELNRIRAQQQQQQAATPAPQVKVRRDVNNPEAGVMPVNSFEKFSGPRYGRHREYERRFYYGKRPKAPVNDYDFYVDEVDRKKEIHNVYYYKKGAAPKLVAVERHTHVSFLENYDVDKEDHGKLTKY